LYSEDKKDESFSDKIQLMSCENVAETIWFVNVLLSLPQDISVGMILDEKSGRGIIDAVERLYEHSTRFTDPVMKIESQRRKH